ncbi:type 1 fimbrial protein [Pectobacterium sp. B1J-3]|uniref:type 1 fimbrial protein n=1 Tax=Pectobacterium sp. B1J-3 TaxID=3385371 RepID=UPI003906AC42
MISLLKKFLIVAGTMGVVPCAFSSSGTIHFVGAIVAPVCEIETSSISNMVTASCYQQGKTHIQSITDWSLINTLPKNIGSVEFRELSANTRLAIVKYD